MRGSAILLLVLASIAGCHTPPPSAYVHGTGVEKPTDQISLGTNAAGEACVQNPTGVRGADVFCGTWQQPSARVEFGGAASAADLPAQSSGGVWRAGIDARMQCDAPSPTTILGGQPALMMQCTSRLGGWPQVAMVAVVNGSLWRGDGVLPAATVLERSIGVLSGVERPGVAPPGSAADGLLARRLASRPFTASDVGAFDQLMTAGIRANLANDPADAELAFRAALAQQRKVLGKDDPNIAITLMSLAVQLSDQGRYAEADELFAEAAPLVPRASDSTAPARLLHYRGLHAKNQEQWDKALSLLAQAEAAYAVLIPADALGASSGATGSLISTGRQGSALVRPNPELLADPRAQLAMVGLIEARRNRALVLRELGRPEQAQALVDSAVDLARANGVDRPMLSARLYRTGAETALSHGADATALADLARSSGRFEVALPGSKTLAETEFLRAGEMQRAGSSGSAVPVCRAAVQAMIALKTGISTELIAPCLAAYANEADRHADQRQTLLAEMFTAAQVAQGGVTSEQIAEASARLRENARDPKVAGAIRAWQDATDKLSVLYGQRDAIAAARALGRQPPAGVTQADIDRQIADGQATVASADSALQAAAPNYGQLVQQVVPAADVMAALHPNEAFVAITLSEHAGWVFLLRSGNAGIAVSPVKGGTEHIATLVHDIRAGIELTASGLPKFDIDGARELYATTLGGVAGSMDGVTSLVIAPTGPLLSLPFAVLLTGPADPTALASAPWLIRKYAVSDVPAPANFVSLRRIAATARAARPWFGFGDFRPITLAQAQRSFPGTTCGDSAALLAGLPALPYTLKELEAARQLMGATTSDELLGPAFTTDAVMRTRLKDYRTLQFSTHALLPTDLRCQDQPAIVTSTPAGAANASGALLTSDRVLGLDLDADLVILSACNSGGPGGTTAGESLSGLARAFFYAGARSMLVTHWSVNDQAAAFLVTETLRRMRADASIGVAAAMRGAELALLDAAVHAPNSPAAHPFFWAPFAVIGEGGENGGPS
jgi:CHAT domain-containing protein/tetratricopeptide (TPR) repeat protein